MYFYKLLITEFTHEVIRNVFYLLCFNKEFAIFESRCKNENFYQMLYHLKKIK